MNLQDAELVQRSLSGDTKAFSRLVERYQNVACALAYSIVGDFSLAEDVAQTAFLAAYNTLPKLKEPEKFSAWLNGIVSHLAVDQVRRLKRQPIQLTEADAVAAAPRSLESHDDPHGALQALVHTLEEPQRQAITLKYFARLSYKQIGEVMGVPASTVRGYLARGMAQLRNRGRDHREAEDGEAR